MSDVAGQIGVRNAMQITSTLQVVSRQTDLCRRWDEGRGWESGGSQFLPDPEGGDSWVGGSGTPLYGVDPGVLSALRGLSKAARQRKPRPLDVTVTTYCIKDMYLAWF